MPGPLAVIVRNIVLILLAVFVFTIWWFELGDRCTLFHIKQAWQPVLYGDARYGIAHCSDDRSATVQIFGIVILAALTVALGYLVGQLERHRPRLTAGLIASCSMLVVTFGIQFAREPDLRLLPERVLLAALLIGALASGLGVLGAWLAVRRRAPVTNV